MKYELTLHDAAEPNGTIDMVRLARIAQGITKVADGALQLRLRGLSFGPGRPSKDKLALENAMRITLTGMRPGSTVLDIECDTFGETLPNIQLDAFRAEGQTDLKKTTPMGLFIETYHIALDNDGRKDLLDKNLLKELREFRKAFRGPDERMTIANRGSVKKLELDKHAFERIHDLEVAIPEPSITVVNGHLDMIRHSKALIEIKPEKGKPIEGFLGKDLTMDDVQRFFGRAVTVKGLLHVRADGKRLVEVQRLFEPTAGDAYFSRHAASETVEQQLQRQVLKKAGKQQRDIAGKWPGGEDLETILRMLDE
ncbi:MAG: hypothetical protein JST98_11675 [Bacteroidetes bacterium]|nr:hypothetical protein [Bacteroidota bacterium]